MKPKDSYSIRILYYGNHIRTMSGLTRAQAKEQFYTHYDLYDCCPQVVVNDRVLSVGEALKHFGRRKASPL